MTPSAPVKFHAFKTSPDERWASLAEIGRAARHAEDLGYDAINLPEHIIVPAGTTVLPAFHYDKPLLAGHLGAMTSRIRFCMYVVVLPYHPPVQFAKTLATLDHLINGRLTVGFGVGWFEQEFELLGIRFADRGRITDEYVAAMIELWTKDPANFVGDHVAIRNASQQPKCKQLPHVPLWVGGSGAAARRRVVQFGNGWVPMSGSLESVAAEADLIRAGLEERGRSATEVEFAYKVHIGSKSSGAVGSATKSGSEPWCYRDPDEVTSVIEQLRASGFNNVSLYFDWEKPADLMGELEWFAAEVMPHFR